MIRVLWLLLGALLAGCGGLEGPFESPHFQLLTDVQPAPPLSAEAERLHGQLAKRFGVDPKVVRGLLVVFAHRDDYLEAVGELPISGTHLGLTTRWDTEVDVGLYTYRGPTCVLSWQLLGRAVLAHELAHLFVLQILGQDVPRWKNEGLAYALATDGLPQPDGTVFPAVVACRAIARGVKVALSGRDLDRAWLEDQTRRAVEGRPLDGEGLLTVGPALVRFGLETQGWADARAVKAWRPDPEAFFAWLESSAAPVGPRFAPLVEVPRDPRLQPL